MIYEPGEIVYRPMVDGKKYWAQKFEVVECKAMTKSDMSYVVKTDSGQTEIAEGKNLYAWKNRALADAKTIAIQNVIEALVQHAADREQ